MVKFKNIEEFCASENLTRQDLKEMILRSTLELLGNCSRNFDEDPAVTERVAMPLYFFNKLLDKLE